MEWFTTEVSKGLKAVKGDLVEVGEKLDAGEVKMNELQKDVKENIEDTKKATETVKEAAAAAKRNKDMAFLGASVLEFIILLVLMIVIK